VREANSQARGAVLVSSTGVDRRLTQTPLQAESVDVVIGRVAGIAANGAQPGAAAPLGAINLAYRNFHEPWGRCQRADCNERNRRCLPQRGLDLVSHQNSQAKTNSGACDYQQGVNWKLLGRF
jgi:hypothetical protein